MRHELELLFLDDFEESTSPFTSTGELENIPEEALAAVLEGESRAEGYGLGVPLASDAGREPQGRKLRGETKADRRRCRPRCGWCEYRPEPSARNHRFGGLRYRRRRRRLPQDDPGNERYRPVPHLRGRAYHRLAR